MHACKQFRHYFGRIMYVTYAPRRQYIASLWVMNERTKAAWVFTRSMRSMRSMRGGFIFRNLMLICVDGSVWSHGVSIFATSHTGRWTTRTRKSIECVNKCMCEWHSLTSRPKLSQCHSARIPHHGHGHGIFILATHPEGIWTLSLCKGHALKQSDTTTHRMHRTHRTQYYGFQP